MALWTGKQRDIDHDVSYGYQETAAWDRRAKVWRTSNGIAFVYIDRHTRARRMTKARYQTDVARFYPLAVGA